MDVEDYQRLQKQVGSLQREHDRTAGALTESKKRLAEYGCTNLKQAKAKLTKLERELAGLERGFERELKAFEKEMEKGHG